MLAIRVLLTGSPTFPSESAILFTQLLTCPQINSQEKAKMPPRLPTGPTNPARPPLDDDDRTMLNRFVDALLEVAKWLLFRLTLKWFK